MVSNTLKPFFFSIFAAMKVDDVVPISYPILYSISYPIHNISDCFMLHVQHCVCLVAPYPFRTEALDDYDPIRVVDITGGGTVC